MNPFIASLLILLAPWGIYFLIKRIAFLALRGILSSVKSGKNLDAALSVKFDEAYDKDNLEEIIKVEEDAMYARLEILSKPRVSQEAKRIHLNHIMEWTAKNNYPGNKRQVELLIAAIKANQKYPEILSLLSSHLHTVSNKMEHNENKKSKSFRKIHSPKLSTYATPGSVSIWLTIFIYCFFVFVFRLLDELHMFLQVIFWGLMIFALYLSFGRLLIKSLLLKLSLAFVLTAVYLNVYSYWNHLKVGPQYFSLEQTEVEIQYPSWLIADDVSPTKSGCGEPLIVTGNNQFAPFKIKYASKEIEALDNECHIVSEILAEPSATNKPNLFYIRPKNLRNLWGKSKTTVTPAWSDPKTGEAITQNLEIRFENLIWYYGRQIWAAGIGGTIAVLLVDYIKSKIKPR